MNYNYLNILESFLFKTSKNPKYYLYFSPVAAGFFVSPLFVLTLQYYEKDIITYSVVSFC